MIEKNDRETKPSMIREGMRRRSLLLGTTSLVAGLAASSTTAAAQQAQETILPKPAAAWREMTVDGNGDCG